VQKEEKLSNNKQRVPLFFVDKMAPQTETTDAAPEAQEQEGPPKAEIESEPSPSSMKQDETTNAAETTEDATQAEAEGEKAAPTFLSRCIDFYWDNEFLILIVLVILLARAYPPLGADYLQPQITSTWIAVIFIFGA
jgi:hypothetical protein